MAGLILSIDQGTTSSRAILFDDAGGVRASAQREHRQYYPNPGWVEHDAEEIAATVIGLCRQVLAQAEGPVASIGITNQRETCLLWDATTSRPLAPAIVWQDRRTADSCADLKARGLEPAVRRRTGLLLDPYFSGTKLAWLLDHVPGARERAERGEIKAGTIDSYLLWRLTGGRAHLTDATNASRTLLYNIHDQDWDAWLLDLFGIPRQILPQVWDSAADFGMTERWVMGQAIAIGGIAGDQQAALVGQACFRPGMIKATYGTGAFLMLNTGADPVGSDPGLLTTIGYRLNGETTYALEGSIFSAGSGIKWLRDRLGLIETAAESESLATSIADNRGVYLVPAFTGLGAPHWKPDLRAALSGLTLDAGRAELARAVLEAVAYQSRDLIDAMFAGIDGSRHSLRADGGMTANGFLMQFLADMLDCPVEVPVVAETTALGAAYLAGLQAGLFRDLDHVADCWRRDRRFEAQMAESDRALLVDGWAAALAKL